VHNARIVASGCRITRPRRGSPVEANTSSMLPPLTRCRPAAREARTATAASAADGAGRSAQLAD
jgi:hypothetical protein